MKKLLIFIMLLPLPLMAEQDLQISGFGSIGTMWVGSDKYGYRQDLSYSDGVFKDEVDLSSTSSLGLQLDYVASPSIDFVYQAVYRNQHDFDFNSATNLAFIRYTPNPSWSIRVGRTTFDLYLLSDYRDVNYAYPWAHIPNEIYAMVPHRYVDGMDIAFKKPFKKFTFQTKIYTGKNAAQFLTRLGQEIQEGDSKLDNIAGITFDFESMDWVAKLKYTQVKLAEEVNQQIIGGLVGLATFAPNFNFIWPNAANFSEELTLNNRKASYVSLSGRYDFTRWSVIGEMSKVDSDSIIVPHTNSGYISGIYRLGRHSLFASYAYSKANNFNLSSQNINLQALGFIPGGLEVHNAVDTILNIYSSNQETRSLGWRWDIDDRVAFTLQWDITEIKPEGTGIWLRDLSIPGGPSESFNTIFTNVSFSF